MREPRRWGFSVSRSEYFQVSVINTLDVLAHRMAEVYLEERIAAGGA